MNPIVLRSLNLCKSYREGPQVVEVLNGADLTLRAGEKLAIVGASGSGKSTLLNLLGGLDAPDSGEVLLDEKPFSSLDDNSRGKIRNRKLGFVYQFHHLLPEFTAAENIAMPMRIAGMNKNTIAEKTDALLARVGLSARGLHKPAELSGGERQRVAIARSLANDPSCVLMDEPTGNLDTKNANNIVELIEELSSQVRTAFVIVSHDEKLAARLDRVLELDSGKICEFVAAGGRA